MKIKIFNQTIYFKHEFNLIYYDTQDRVVHMQLTWTNGISNFNHKTKYGNYSVLNTLFASFFSLVAGCTLIISKN